MLEIRLHKKREPTMLADPVVQIVDRLLSNTLFAKLNSYNYIPSNINLIPLNQPFIFLVYIRTDILNHHGKVGVSGSSPLGSLPQNPRASRLWGFSYVREKMRTICFC